MDEILEEKQSTVENDVITSEDSSTEESTLEQNDGDVCEESCNSAESSDGNSSDDEKIEDAVLVSIEKLSDKVEQLSKQFDAKILHTAHEEKIVDQMHTELQRYKEDLYAQLVRPILLDIIEIRDSIQRMSQTYAMKPEEEQTIPLKTFSDYAYDVQDILEKNNIVIYKSNEGDTFTPIKQRVVKKINTPVEDLHGKVAESMSDGYEYMGKTISPEKIAVYVYEVADNKEGEESNG